MNKFLSFELFEHGYSTNNKAVDELFGKCIDIYHAVNEWSKTRSSESSRVRWVTGEKGEKDAKREIEWWLGGIETGEVKNLYDKIIDGIEIPGLFFSNQGFYNIKVATDFPTQFDSNVVINVNIGHDGEKIVLSISSGYPNQTKKIEDSIEAYLKEHCDFEFKIGDLTLIEYMEKNKGRTAARKFGFNPKHSHE